MIFLALLVLLGFPATVLLAALAIAAFLRWMHGRDVHSRITP
jgi:hypothetical protein